MARLSSDVSIGLKNGKMITSLNYADLAEQAIRSGGKFGGLTTTSLRGIYGLIVNVSSEVNGEEEFEKRRADIQYLKVRMAYEAGRKNEVKQFLEKTSLKDALDSVDDYQRFLLYCRYAESLVAYFKFYGGRDR